MNKNGVRLAGAFLSAILAAPGTASDHYRMAGSNGDFYFGHISYTEAKSDGSDPTIQREGAVAPEPATLNAPVGPGDVIRTTEAHRCEIQFDTGTIVRLDVKTELKVETILAGSLSVDRGMSNLVLSSGRIYIMFKQYDGREIFQVMTPGAAVNLKHDSVAVIAFSGDGPTEVRVKAGKASVLFGADAAHSRTKTVKKLGYLVVFADGRFEEPGYPSDTAFETWNEGLNENFLALHKGLTSLPKPVRTLPLAVFDFAQRFGNSNGEWLWDDLYGYVWRPFLNDRRYPWGNWSPYVYGRWAEVGNSMFWVPEEPWGWVPYHLGLWQWDRTLGWVWLPGSLFAPAWAVWDFFDGYFAWRPWTLFDWCLQGYSLGLSYASGSYDQGGLWPYYRWSGVNLPDPVIPPLTKIRKDQLKKGTASSVPMPKEMKKAYGNVVAALGRKDGRLMESLKGVPVRSVFAARGDLNALRLHEKVLAWDKVRAGSAAPVASGTISAQQPPANPSRDALRAYRDNALGGIRRSSGTVFSDAVPRLAEEPVTAGAVRFRDWNPDVRVARSLGVKIDYSSRTNEVRCPELKISSRDTGSFGLRLSTGGVVPVFEHGGFGGYDPSGMGTSAAVGSRAGREQTASREGGRAEGGTTKKD